ncbi:MAG TPA: pyridoxal-5'-phosphate-dependent protein subunit beta, partial [Acidimicrobiales bacterium]|nr:pyridoxal-5'-phosphate-dependent protein subunit beta [Acidimicrobiales bacterium]
MGLEDQIVDRAVYDRTLGRFRDARILLPTFAELADPSLVPSALGASLASVPPDEAHPLNLFRVHWFNGDRDGPVSVPAHIVLGKELTGVEAKIVVAL